MNNSLPNNNSGLLNKVNPEDLKTYLITTGLSIVLFIFLCILLGQKSLDPKTITIIIIIFVLILIFSFVKNKEFFIQFINSTGGLKKVSFIILFNIFLVFLFSILPNEYKNNYAYIILPIIIFIGIVLFYDAFTSNKNNQPQNLIDLINLERINYSLILFSLLIFIIILYIANPGSYVTKFAWLSTIFTILFCSISAVYLLTVMKTKDSSKKETNETNLPPFSFLGMNPFTIMSILIFIISLIFIIPFIINESSSTEKNIKNSTISIMIILFFSFWLISLIKSMFFYSKTDISLIQKIQKNLETYNKISQTIFLILLGITTTAVLLYWLLLFYNNVIVSTTIGNIFIYTFALIAISILVYKLVVKTSVYKDSPIFQLIFNSLFYIPCLLVSLFDNVSNAIPKNKTKNDIVNGLASGISSIKKSASEPTPFSYYIILIISIILLLSYFSLPSLLRSFTQQGGQILINNPINTSSSTPLASYAQLNNSIDNHNYQYGLSFWFYMDSANPSTNKSYETFTNILDYGGKPKVTYNASLNTLRITMKIGEESNKYNSENRPKRKFDSNGNLILYEKKDILLQKWNNIIINYTGGVLDIFYNGDLVKSSIGVIPYYNNNLPQTNTETSETSETSENYDNLIVGQDNGLYGQICNVNYFKTSLNIFQIHYLYNSVKDKSPPALISDDRIINLDPKLGMNIGNILGESTIMGDTPPQESSKYPENDEDLHKNSKEMASSSSSDIMDYFSLKWYFNANHDKYN